MQLWRRLIGGMALIAGGLWLAADSGFISVPKYISEGLWAAFVILGTIGIQMFLGPRRNIPDPSPQISAVGVIVPTGTAAVVVTTWNVQDAWGYIIPASIIVVTTVLAVAAFRFASKNQNEIGEARFDATSNDG